MFYSDIVGEWSLETIVSSMNCRNIIAMPGFTRSIHVFKNSRTLLKLNRYDESDMIHLISDKSDKVF